MDTIIAIRLMWAEIIINGALILANIATHMRARRLLKSADDIFREAMAYRRQAEQALEDARAPGIRFDVPYRQAQGEAQSIVIEETPEGRIIRLEAIFEGELIEVITPLGEEVPAGFPDTAAQ